MNGERTCFTINTNTYLLLVSYKRLEIRVTTEQSQSDRVSTVDETGGASSRVTVLPRRENREFAVDLEICPYIAIQDHPLSFYFIVAAAAVGIPLCSSFASLVSLISHFPFRTEMLLNSLLIFSTQPNDHRPVITSPSLSLSLISTPI